MAASLPMESNPDVMNKYLEKLGVSTKWRMVDVIGLEGDVLAWVPRPVLAVVLLFPLSDAYEEHRREQENELKDKGTEPPKEVFHMRQVLSNICGTIALVHSVANNVHDIEISEGILKKYLSDAKDLDAAAKGALLENSQAILEAYQNIALAEANETDNSDGTPTNHFVTFIHKDGHLYELDGRKLCPVNHGPTSPELLLEDAAKICRQFIEREPDNICFNVVALVPTV